MDFFNQLVLQFKSVFSKMSQSQKVSFLVLFGAIAVCLIAVFMWSAKPDYVVLFADLSTADAAKIHTKLTELNVPYEISGTTIKVPSKNVYETRLELANEGLPKGSTVGFEIFDKANLGQTDYLQRLNFQRALEGELSRTISSLETVEFARVHLVIPKPTIFSEEQEDVSASIIITTQTGGFLAKSNVLSITHLVASSVEGLSPSNVTIIDSNGNLLSGIMENNIAVSLTNSQLEVQKKIENYLSNKISSFLLGVLGPGNAIVRVNAELDFSQKEETKESFNPESQVARSENRIEETVSGKENDSDSSVEKTITNFEINKSVKHIIGATGSISRLSLAVVIDGTYKYEGEGKSRERIYVPRTDDEKDSIKKLVETSIGINEKRGDTIEVINIPFDKSYIEEQKSELQKMRLNRNIKSAVEYWPWLVVLLIFFALFISLQKIISQATLEKPSVAGRGRSRVAGRGGIENDFYEKLQEKEIAEIERQKAEDRAQQLIREQMDMEVSGLAEQNPDAVAKIIKEWLSED